MKKQFKTALVFAVVLTALFAIMCVSVNAANSDVSITYQNGKAILQANNSSVKSSVLVQATYDEAGKMSEVETYNITYDENNAAQVELWDLESGIKQKIFVWKSLQSGIPLSSVTESSLIVPDTHEQITTRSKMAVVSGGFSVSAVDGKELITIDAYTADDGADENGKITLCIDNSVFKTDPSAILKEGTPFYYTLNSNGYIDRIDVLNAIDYTDSKSIQRAIFGAELTGTQTVTAITNPAMASADVISGTSYKDGKQEAIQQYTGDVNDVYDKAVFKLAPVIKKGNGALFFMTGDVADGYFASDLDEGDAHMITNNATVIVCDLNEAKNKVKVGTLADVQASRFTTPAKVAYTGEYRNFVAWDKVVDDNSYDDNSDIVYALVKLVDDDITEIYVILPEES